ncbi:hypothetical protein AXX17_AT5G32520 [Arabidopsis thaliana]|uniref:Uncharacterized protein n=1 Tax=Arabidopsis thaliana TaxID=3702 RepID=A0A178UG02_ARATH|nr:hypothetical protein AXX17_AT5G32520 [Arabidopsis thaliana]
MKILLKKAVGKHDNSGFYSIDSLVMILLSKDIDLKVWLHKPFIPKLKTQDNSLDP